MWGGSKVIPSHSPNPSWKLNEKETNAKSKGPKTISNGKLIFGFHCIVLKSKFHFQGPGGLVDMCAAADSPHPQLSKEKAQLLSFIHGLGPVGCFLRKKIKINGGTIASKTTPFPPYGNGFRVHVVVFSR